MTHDFNEQLDWSQRCGDEPFWDAVYRKAFPNLVNHMAGSGNHDSQRRGVDRILWLSNGQPVYIDEKKRRLVREDICLEYVSVDTRNEPGWIKKPLAIDFLAYAFMPSQTVYLLPWQPLRRAWEENEQTWIQWAKSRHNGFSHVEARNDGYTTQSVAVPIKRLFAAMNRACIIRVELN